MTKTELAWLAGLLEGEGSFLRGPPSAPNQPRITMEMTDRDVVERAARLFGVAFAATRRHEKNKRWKPTFRCQFKGTKAVALMREMRPWMGERRRAQIDRALASHVYKRPGDNTRKLTPALVRRIRRSTEPSEKLGAKLGISGNGIRKIRRGEIWKAVA